MDGLCWALTHVFDELRVLEDEEAHERVLVLVLASLLFVDELLQVFADLRGASDQLVGERLQLSVQLQTDNNKKT